MEYSAVIVVIAALISLGDCHKRQHQRRSLLHDQRYLGVRFESEPDNHQLSFDSILLNCLFVIENANVKNVNLEWKKDGSVLNLKHGQRTVFSNGSLHIENAKSSDEGAYQCSVSVVTADESSWTYLSRKALIRLPDLPKFESQPLDQIAVRGHPVVFHCFTPAGAITSVTWYHNNVPLSNKGEFHVLPISNSLEISSVQLRHEGEYKCMVEGAGKRRTSQTARLRITQDSSVMSPEVAFLTSPRGQVLNEGASILLECLATGLTIPEVRWLKDSRQVLVDGKRIRRVGISSLIIENSTMEDAALYTCRASNTVDSKDRTVTVQIRSIPHVTTKPRDMVALETADVEMECSASGRPLPSVSWFKNGEEIVPSEYFVIEPNRLRILGVVKADQGVYQCIVQNDAGTEQAAAQLLVDAAGPTYLASVGLGKLVHRGAGKMPADDSSSVAASSGRPMVPSAPLGLRSSSFGSRVINLAWDPPVQRHGQIMRYHVFFKEENVKRERTFNCTTTSATLTGLQPDTLYLISVSAENEAGSGKTSDHIKITTSKEQSVPGRVTELEAKAVGSETIEVRWKPPQGGPAALRYKLFYIKHPSGGEKETQTVTSATTYTFHGMDKYTEYQIRVEADGENGSGLSSEKILVRTHSDVPKEPPRDVAVEVVSSSSIRVTWKAPLDGINGDITGYRVRYKPKLRGSKGNTYVIDASEREYTITGLDRDTQYLVKVAVVNHNGTGEFSDWLHVSTPLNDKEEALLGAPRELRPQAGLDYILLSWLPPADESILVRGYQVGWGHNIPDVSTARVAGNVLQYKISNLKSGRDYVVSLRGSNKKGLGFPIYETVRTLSPSTAAFFGDEELVDPAATPVGVRAESLSATSVRVSWTEPDINAFNTFYTVKSSTSLDGNQMRTFNTSDPWIVIDSLRPATEYEFAVRARSSDGGVSQWSMAARNKTLPAAPSSAPRDLTVLPAASGDPHSVSLNWQPPKYANGDIEEYLVYYSDRASLPDKDWNINYVPGDRLSHHVSNLLPKAAYHFKIQARNEKGYGPLSPIQSFIPNGSLRPSAVRPEMGDSQWLELLRLILSNPMYLAVLIAIALLMLLCIVLVAVCVTKRSNVQKRGYTAGRKSSAGQQGDLWINHSSGSHVRGPASDYLAEGMQPALTERLTGAEVVDSPPPRYHALQDSAYGSVSVRNSRTPVRQSVSSCDEDRRPIVGRAKPIIASVHNYGPDDGQATLSRSYHQSSSSLEGRQRTPQVVYTGAGRHQPIAKIDFNDSPYGSSSAINSATPPLPVQAPPSGPPIVDGYRTLRGTPPNSNQLRSFTQLAGAPPQIRPVVVAGGRQLPVGRATAQPRVNVANIYSPYASCSSDTEIDKKEVQNEMEMQPTGSATQVQPSNSTEELNAQMENLDTMIDDLQKFQHEFGTGGNQVPT